MLPRRIRWASEYEMSAWVCRGEERVTRGGCDGVRVHARENMGFAPRTCSRHAEDGVLALGGGLGLSNDGELALGGGLGLSNDGELAELLIEHDNPLGVDDWCAPYAQAGAAVRRESRLSSHL